VGVRARWGWLLVVAAIFAAGATLSARDGRADHLHRVQGDDAARTRQGKRPMNGDVRWRAESLGGGVAAPAGARGGHSSERSAASTPPAPLRSRIVSWGRGSWCWFGDPRAVTVVAPRERTFVGWIDWNGRIRVGAYNPHTGARTTVTVGVLSRDDHGSPAILVEPDKRLTIFWAGHDGGAMYYRTSRRPEDIHAWGPVHLVSSQLRDYLGFTYPNPVILPAEHNRLYLFWRGANWSQDFTTRDVDGRWGQARSLITNLGERPYVKVDSNGRDTIALAFTDAHPGDAVTSIFYMTLRGGWLRHADGNAIVALNSTPIAARSADTVYDADATGVPAWVWDVAIGRTGHPVIVYATFPSPSHHIYWYARWTGRAWVSHLLTVGGPTVSPGTLETEYSGGLALDHTDPATVYLSRKVRGWFQIERWTTPDGGHRWVHRTVVRTNGADNIRPVVTRGSRGGPISLSWLHGHYGFYTTYRTSVDSLG